MEAMCAGLPCVVSKIRGNVDLIDEGKGGHLIDPYDYEGYAEAINKVLSDKVAALDMGKYNKEMVKQYDIEKVKQIMLETYQEILSQK